ARSSPRASSPRSNRGSCARASDPSRSSRRASARASTTSSETRRSPPRSASRVEIESALAAAPAKRERGALLRLLAQSELGTGHHEAAFDRIGEALGLLDESTDANEIAHLLYLRGTAYGQLNQHLTAAEALEQARDTLERHEVNDPRLRSRILVALGTAYRRLNRTAKAMQTYASALDLASASNELRTAAQGYMGVAVSLYDAGELDAAIGSYRRALELFRSEEDRSFELSVL